MTKKDRLPPGQRLVERFPVLHYGDTPLFDENRWDFKVTGLVEIPLRFTYKEFMSLPSTELTTDFHCVTGWSKFDFRWKGVLFKAIASISKPHDEARFVSIICEHGYTTNLSLEFDMDNDVILAYEYNGKPLTPEHGFPLRLVVPKNMHIKVQNG